MTTAANIAKRAARGAVVLGGTAAALGLAAVLVSLGTSEIAARAEKLPSSTETAPVPVRIVQLVERTGYEVTSRYSGRVEARQVVDIGFEAGGTISEIRVEEGDRVAAGEILAQVDTRALSADRAAQVAALEALKAQAELARLTADRQKALLDQNHVSAQRYDEARLQLVAVEAQIRQAEAAVVAIDVALDKTVLRAPFDAVVGRRSADLGARISAGTPVLRLFEEGATRFRLGLPEQVAAQFSEGDQLSVEISGTDYAATVELIRPDIEPATRTRPVILTLAGATHLPEAALGSMEVMRTAPGEGAWVPTAALTEGVRGLWTLYLVDDGKARREAVELIHSDGDRAFVRGAFGDAASIIAEGPHRLSDGQPVTPVN